MNKTSALLNCGLPQLADVLYEQNGNIYNFTKSEVRMIKETIIEFDNYYQSGWKESESRAILKGIANDYAKTYRAPSLIID